MKIEFKNTFFVIIAALTIAIPTGIIIQNKNSIKRTDTQVLRLIEVASAAPVTQETKKPESQKIEQQPVQEPVVEPVKEEVPASVPVVTYSTNCESYRPLIQKYFGDATPAAMITMIHESSCNPYAVSATNDFGLFQLNGQQIYEPEQNIAIAYQKFIHPRRGTNPNFSAWYAVCTPDLVPKYDGIWCK